MDARPEAFGQFMKTREAAASAYVNGDAGPLAGITTDRSPATFLGPGGGWLQGADDVASSYARGARSFQPNGESRLEVLQSDESGDLAFWTGIQHAKVQPEGRDGPTPMDLRITEVFRREGGAWKLVHRHADPLAKG